MAGYEIANLNTMLNALGEDRVLEILSQFSCPLNADVESFIHRKAIPFAKQGFSQTHLVFASYKQERVLTGYFTLANKYIMVSSKHLSSTFRRRLSNFATYDHNLKSYTLAAPLIAQLGKNYANKFNNLITGDELLLLACNKVKQTQLDIGGKFVYLECEDKPCLINFYERNGFVVFDSRKLDRDETQFKGDYLLQLIKYLKR